MTSERGSDIPLSECSADRRRAAWISVWSIVVAIVAAALTTLIPQ